jgi:uncharacterized protein (TIGR03382 family)
VAQADCDAIESDPALELCVSTDAGCAGVYTDGRGCEAYCAVAGMVCVARRGGEPGCVEEPERPIPCDAANDHQSDWCDCAPAEPPDPPPEINPGIRPLARQGRVLTWCGAPIRLVGYGHYAVVAERAFDAEAYLDLLAERGLNFVRLWGQYQWANDLMPFAGTRGDRDLTRPDPAFFERLRSVVSAAADRGIIVQVTLFDSVQFEGAADSGNRWVNSPYRRANNQQPYLDDPRDFNVVDGLPPVWSEANQPYIERVVDTLCDLPNVIYEAMNEPEGSGGDPGRGTPAFVTAVVESLDQLLARPQCTGSRVIGTNDNTLRTAAHPAVDLVAVHVPPARAGDYAGLDRPVLVSNDGDRSQVSDDYGFGDIGEGDRAARVARYGGAAFPIGGRTGHAHLEILDKDFHGASWLSQDYQPRVVNHSPELLDALAPYATHPPAPCSPPQAAPDAGVVTDAGTPLDSGPADAAEVDRPDAAPPPPPGTPDAAPARPAGDGAPSPDGDRTAGDDAPTSGGCTATEGAPAPSGMALLALLATLRRRRGSRPHP